MLRAFHVGKARTSHDEPRDAIAVVSEDGSAHHGENEVRSVSQAANNINWLINNFVERVPGVQEAVVVSSDGLPMAASTGLDRASADRFAAVSSGLIGLAYGAAGRFGGGAVNEVIVEMEVLEVVF